MKEYKTVAGPVGLSINQNESFEVAVNQYASIINREAQGGWQLEMIHEIPVQRNNGCLAGLLSSFGAAAATETVRFNMLIFSREV